MLMTAAEPEKALCRCSQSAALTAPQKSSLASSCDGTSAPRPCSTFFSTSRGHLSLMAVPLTPASCGTTACQSVTTFCVHTQQDG